MSEKIMYWSSVAFAVVAIILVIATTCVATGNRDLQTEVTKRQNAITMATNLVQLNQSVAQSLADIIITKNDKGVYDLLTSQGISIRKSDAVKATEQEKTTDSAKKSVRR